MNLVARGSLPRRIIRLHLTMQMRGNKGRNAVCLSLLSGSLTAMYVRMQISAKCHLSSVDCGTEFPYLVKSCKPSGATRKPHAGGHFNISTGQARIRPPTTASEKFLLFFSIPFSN